MEPKLCEYLKQLDELIDRNDNRYQLIFRGHADATWKLESSAARRIKLNTGENELMQKDFIKYHNVLVNRAKRNIKKNEINGSAKLYDLEILAEIQHLGGATCLTDFTTNFLIALWFASSKAVNKKEEETDGKIYVINLLSHKNIKDIKQIKSEQELGTKIPDLLTNSFKEKKSSKFYAWQPAKLNKRIDHQDSLFIFGLPRITEDNYKEIIVKKGDKHDIRRELKKYFDLDVENIFPDLQGFSFDANNVNAPFNDLYCRSCLEISLDYLESGMVKEHQKYFEKAINCKSAYNKDCQKNSEPCEIKDVSELYYERGLFYLKNDQTTDSQKIEAIDDFEKVLNSTSSKKKVDCHDSIAYLCYDLLKIDKSYYDKAIKEYDIILNQYNTDHKYDSFYLSILELSIMKKDQQTYNWYLKKLEEEIEINCDNGKFLKHLINILSEFVFGKSKFRPNMILEELIKEKIETFDDDFIWDFNDLKNWFKETYPKINFDNFFEKIDNLQNSWIEKSFNTNPA